MCDELLELFQWSEYTDSDIQFRKAEAPGALGREHDSVKLCGEWRQSQPMKRLGGDGSSPRELRLLLLNASVPHLFAVKQALLKAAAYYFYKLCLTQPVF